MSRPLATRLLPRSLAGQLIISLLLAIAVAQVAGFMIFASERREAIIGVRRENVLQRTASLVRMLDHSRGRRDEALTETLLTAATSTRLRFWISPDSAVPEGAFGKDGGDQDLARSLADRLNAPPGRPIRIKAEDGHPRFLKMPETIREMHRDWHHERGHHEGRLREREDDDEDDDHEYSGDRREVLPVGLTLSVALTDGQWLNGVLLARPPKVWGLRGLTAILLTVLAVSVVSILVLRRLTRPLGDLAQAADALGRGEVLPPLEPTGPSEIRRTTAAFNTMQDRLHRFVADRTRMLAAISHDLRTPLTSLRLRAEFIKDDDENREKILAILSEMERITEAALAFARDEQASEETEDTDIASLCRSVADELVDLGLDVSVAAADPVVLACHPVALKRAIRNVVENAAHYGERARLTISRLPDRIEIRVEDDGPGIPEDEFDTVFEPFTRLETSRSAETGGVGLGLAIARNIMRAHGGDIRLENLPSRGLGVTMSLPLPAASA